MFELSLGYLTLPKATALDVVASAAAAGLGRAGLRIGGRLPSDEGPWLIGHSDRVAEVRKCAADNGVSVSSVAAYYVGPETAPADFQPVFDVASALSCENVCISGYDNVEARLNQTLLRLAESASMQGLRLALEFVPYSEVRSLGAALRVLDGVPHKSAGILLDMIHFMRSDGAVADLAKVPGGRLCFAQICDAPLKKPPFDKLAEEARTQRLFPGEGEFPIKDILGVLDPATEIEIETPHPALRGQPLAEQARRSADAVRRYLQGAGS